MDRVLLQPSDSLDPVDPTAETVINGTPYDASKPERVGREPGQPQDAAASAIKGRLVTAATLYLSA